MSGNKDNDNKESKSMNPAILAKVSKKLNQRVRTTPSILSPAYKTSRSFSEGDGIVTKEEDDDDSQHSCQHQEYIFDNGIDSEIYWDIIDNQLPIDAWGMKQWYSLFKDTYFKVFEKPFIVSRQQFNTVFTEFLYSARDDYHLANIDIKRFIHWFAYDHMQYCKKLNRRFNFGSMKFKLGDFYERVMTSIEKKEKAHGMRIRNVVIDSRNIKASIDENYQDHCDLLIKQLGFPIMLYYNIKFIHNDTPDAVNSILKKIAERIKFEKNQQGEFGEIEYVKEICYNSIYFSPYPFENKNKFKNYVSWRDVFETRIVKFSIDKEGWWHSTNLDRNPITCVDQFSKKRRVRSRKK